MLSYVSLGLLLFAAGTALAKSSRIVGGELTSVEVYPYIVQMDIFFPWEGIWTQNCAGNILTSYWIMSAAYCFDGLSYNPQYRRFRVGASERHIGGAIHDVEYAINHPDYGRYALYDANINIVKLSTPLLYTATVQKGTLIPQDSVLPDNLSVIIAGWGDIAHGGPAPRELQHAQIYTINNDLCAQRYRDAGLGTVTKDMICAGLLDVGGRDACIGDSGGPLYAQGENTQVIIGVISWGHGCANKTYPGVNTRVASYTNWIIENAK